MRELERDHTDSHNFPAPALAGRVAVVGAGRAGGSIAAAARAAGLDVERGLARARPGRRLDRPPLRPRRQRSATRARPRSLRSSPGIFVGHVSGATGLDALSSAADCGLRDVLAPPAPDDPDRPDRPRRRAVRDLRRRARGRRRWRAPWPSASGMRPFDVPEEGRAAYHAAASMASNFLIALEESAAQLMESAGVADAARSPGAARPSHGRQLGGRRRRGAHRPDRPRRRGDRRPSPGGARRTGPRAAPALRGARRAHTRAGVGPMTAIQVVRTVAELRAALEPARRNGELIGLVPTMGALHAGHLSLIEAARERADVVVMSLFVNPTQFGEGEDLDSYPRDEERDLRLAAEAGAQIVFAPAAGRGLPARLLDARRGRGPDRRPLRRSVAAAAPGHFRGVTTVVAKLLNMAAPDFVFFGQKDAQQAIVIRRMARDLDFATEVVVMPTVREPDGLAMSSRNAYLDAAERERATALNRALAAAVPPSARGRRRRPRRRARRPRRGRDRARVPRGALRGRPRAGTELQRTARSRGRRRAGRQGPPHRQRGHQPRRSRR